MNEQRYGQLVHLLAALVALLLWFISVAIKTIHSAVPDRSGDGDGKTGG